MNLGDEPAFPKAPAVAGNGQVCDCANEGMSTRTWLAGMAMQGILSNHELLTQVDSGMPKLSTKDAAAIYAVACADSVIEALAEPKPEAKP